MPELIYLTFICCNGQALVYIFPCDATFCKSINPILDDDTDYVILF